MYNFFIILIKFIDMILKFIIILLFNVLNVYVLLLSLKFLSKLSNNNLEFYLLMNLVCHHVQKKNLINFSVFLLLKEMEVINFIAIFLHNLIFILK